jgi:hypothetical protein
MSAVEEETGAIAQSFKDLFAGAVGGIAQVLIGPFLSIGFASFSELQIYTCPLPHVLFCS